jgi:hypothetical protein
MSRTPEQALRVLARGQRGLFTIQQARTVGVTDRVRHRMLAGDEIERVHPGVHRFITAAWDWEAVQFAAVLGGGRSAVLSHAPAARLLGLAVPFAGRAEITVTATGCPRLAGVRVHRTRELPDGDTTIVRGIRCTSGPRTLVDLAGRLPWATCTQLVDEAVCAGVTSRSRLHERAEALRPGRAGVGRLIDLVAPGSDAGFWSALERAFFVGVRAHGIKEPLPNAAIRHGGRLLYADALWPEERLIVELHGLRFHSTPAHRERDDERVNLFTLAGHRVLLFTWREVHSDFDDVARKLRQALRTPRRL